MTDLDSPVKRTWLQRDFSVACCIVLGLNFVVIGPVNGKAERTPRTQTYQASLRTLRDVPAEQDVRLAILGDSRTMLLSADSLCDALDAQPGACVNLSSVGGEWASIFALSQALEPYLAEDALILVGLSDYWLEAGNASRLEILPRTHAYAALGHPELALASYFPMSVHRANRMNRLRDALGRAARALERAAGVVPQAGTAAHAALEHQRAFRANVDQWFTPVSDETRAEHLALARRTLGRIRQLAPHVVLVYMPNAAAREVYVDANHPGRRARFFAALRDLAEEFDLPLVSFADEMGANERYKDFHHLERDQAETIGAALAERIRGMRSDG